MPSKPRRQTARRSSAPALTRTRRVWLTLLAAMTLGGGSLYILENKSLPSLQGLDLPPMVATHSSNTIDAIFNTRQTLDTQRWKSIVIHHSGKRFGNEETIDREHRDMSFAGLGHHFIVGNGNGMADGQIHVAFRWRDQQPGAHAAGTNGPWYNHHAISICLVGNGDERPFTQDQLASLVLLVQSLCDRLDIPRENVLLHSSVAATTDPGRLFPADAFYNNLAIPASR